jgi:hypothetical protein
MSEIQMMFVVLQLVVVCACMAFVFVLVRFVPVQVKETLLDPPPNAHYVLLNSKAETLEPETAEAIRLQKTAEVFYHALTFNDGYCSKRVLHQIIEEQWNKHYEKFPEYKKHWLISRIFVEEVVKEFDYMSTGKVVELSSIVVNTDGAEPRSIVYVLLPVNVNGNDTRRLYAVESLVKNFLPPPPPPKPKPIVEGEDEFQWLKEGSPDIVGGGLTAAEPMPVDANLTSGRGGLAGSEPMPVGAKLNGYHQLPKAT